MSFMNDRNALPPDLRAAEWIRKATDDEQAAQSILAHRDAPPSVVCFHAQQVAEKYLKAFLVHTKNWYPKIHPLDALWEECLNVDAAFKATRKETAFLAAFYTSTRYPGDSPEFTWTEAEQAFAAAQRVKNLVLQRLKMRQQRPARPRVGRNRSR